MQLVPRLATLCILRAVPGDFAAHFGIKCSSFCKVNVGTSMRSACTSIGKTDYPSVFLSNRLLERRGTRVGTYVCYILFITAVLFLLRLNHVAQLAGHASFYSFAQLWAGSGFWSNRLAPFFPSTLLSVKLCSRSSKQVVFKQSEL